MAKQSPTPKITTKKHVARLERERQQVTLIKTISITAIVIVTLLIVYGILDTSYLQKRKPVAEVNGEKISMSYWQERVQFSRLNLVNNLQLYQSYQQSFGMDFSQQIQQLQFLLQSPETLGQQVLDQLIDEALVRQEAQKLGISVTKDEVEEKIQGSAEFNFFPNGSPTPTITPTEFSLPTLTSRQLTMYPATPSPTEVLTSTPAPTNTPDPASTATSTAAPATPTFLPQPATLTATPYTLDGYTEQYGNSIDSIKSFDVSESTFRSVYENQLYSEKLLAEIAKDTPRTAEQVWARHILVDDQISLGIVRTLLDSGVDFAKVAKQYSKDTGSGANGGDLGWFERGAMVAEFEQAAFSQEIGVIGKPVKSSFGYHIIQVLDRQELPLTASQYEQNKQTTFTDWLTKTRAEATTAGALTILDVWKENIPALPAAFSQLLQQ